MYEEVTGDMSGTYDTDSTGRDETEMNEDETIIDVHIDEAEMGGQESYEEQTEIEKDDAELHLDGDIEVGDDNIDIGQINQKIAELAYLAEHYLLELERKEVENEQLRLI